MRGYDSGKPGKEKRGRERGRRAGNSQRSPGLIGRLLLLLMRRGSLW